MRQEKSLGALEFRSVQIDDAPRPDNIEIDLRAMLARLWRGKWILGTTTLIGGVMGLLAASQFEATYTATSTVMFDIEEANIVDVGQSVVRLDDTLYNQVEVLQSTRLIERVVDNLELEKYSEFNPALREPEVGVMSVLRDWISIPDWVRGMLRDTGVITPEGPPPDPSEQEDRLKRFIIASVKGAMTLEPIEDSTVLDISITTENPRLSASVANMIASEYIVDQLDAKLEATREATTWLADRVEELRARVQVAEEAVEAARADIARASGTGIEITQAQITALNAALSNARADAARAAAVHDRLNAAVAESRDIGGISEFRTSDLIQSLRDRETELLSQRRTLAESVADDHPAIIRLDAGLKDLRDNMKIEAQRIVDASLLDLEAAEFRVSDLQGELSLLEGRALDQGAAAIRIRQLEREAEASRVLYENFLGRLKETSEQEALQTADARILSPAEPPLFANMASRKRAVILALLAGGLVGIGILFLLEKLNNAFRTPEDLADASEETFLGALPTIGRRIQRRDVIEYFRKKPKSALAEAVRSLRTSVLFSNVDAPPQTVMFTSSIPREGKSTASMLMALTSQQMGRSAIIVDCDLRLPSLARLVKDEQGGKGLLSLIDGSASLEEAIWRDPETGLDVLMTRADEPRSTVNPADILSSDRFRNLLEALKARYDLVIVDSPPTLVVTDARILARLVDAVVYIVQWDKTPKGAVLDGLRGLRDQNAPIAGVAFTRLNEARAARYTYDGYAYYRTRYRDYYVN